MAEENEALFKEIEEEVRKDNAYRLWATYRYYIIGIVITILTFVAVHQIWQDYNMSQKISRGEAFSIALSEINKGEEKNDSADMV